MTAQHRFRFAPLAAPRGKIAELYPQASRRAICLLARHRSDGSPTEFSRAPADAMRAVGRSRRARRLRRQIQSA